MAPVTRRSARIAQDTKPIPSVNVDEASPAKEPASPRGKRKSTENSNESDHEGAPLDSTSLTSPKRQRLAVRTREDESTTLGRKTHLEVEIPISTPTTIRPTPNSWNKGKRIDLLEPEPSSASKQLEEEATQRLASMEPPVRSPMAKPKPTPKSKHITFGDDDDVNKFVAAAASAAPEKKQEDNQEDSDDDEAPEAVSTHTVAKEMQKAAQVASEAAEKQAASLKRKRQEKDNLYKHQAEQRRKRARGVEIHQTKPRPTERSSASPEEENAQVETAITTGRQRHRAEKFNLPAVLPAEFLTDSSSESEDEDEAALQKQLAKKSKKINFEDEGDKRPRDRTVGMTRYRVLAPQGDEALAPKMHRSARNSKENMLKRRRGAVAPGLKKGFLVKR